MKNWSKRCIYGYKEGDSFSSLACQKKVTCFVVHPNGVFRKACCDDHKDEILNSAETGSTLKKVDH